MAKLVVLALCAVVAGVLAEPPSSYLPPQARNAPSSVYGAPNGGGFRSNGKAASFHAQRTGAKSFSYNSLHENQFGGSQGKSFGGSKSFGGGLSQQYGAPSQQYGAPSQGAGFGAGRGANGFGVSQQYGAPALGASSKGGFGGVSQQYGAPAFGASSNGGFGGVSQKYGAPSFGASSNGGFGGVSQQYGAPAFGASSNGGFGGVSQKYGAPSFGASSNGGFGGVSQQYGAPAFGASGNGFGRKSNGAKFGGASGFGAPAPVYGAPSSGYGAPYSKMDDDLSEPANYEYTYEVQAAEESGAEFGHQESREDDSARGVYHVLLPDGRTQIVEYEADEEGFRPVIRYEEPTGYPAARGPQGPY